MWLLVTWWPSRSRLAARSWSGGGSTPSSSRKWAGGSGSGNRRTGRHSPRRATRGEPIGWEAGLTHLQGSGADWWVAGAAVCSAEDAEIDGEEVQRFLTAHALWDRLT